jgi:hypothetical protein
MNQKSKAAIKQLRYFLLRNGCLRSPNTVQRKNKGQTYKKGYEIRFTAMNENELSLIRLLLIKANYKLGRPYVKVNRFIQPVYGKKYYEEFRSFI